MKEMIKIEFKRAFHSKTFYLSLCLGMIICIIEYIVIVVPSAMDILSGFGKPNLIMPNNVFGCWIGQSSDGTMYYYIYSTLIPILAVLAYAGSYCTDRKSGYIKNIYSRGNKVSYLSAKYLASIVAGGLVILIPLICNLMATAAVLPSLVPETAEGTMLGGPYLWSTLLYTYPYLFIILHLILIFVYQTMYIGIALAISEFTDHVFLVWLFPFLLNYFIDTLLHYLGQPFSCYAPLSVLNMDYGSVNIWGVLIQWIIVMGIVSLIYLGKGVRDETY